MKLRAKKESPLRGPCAKVEDFRYRRLRAKETAAAQQRPLKRPDFIITSKMAINIASATLSSLGIGFALFNLWAFAPSACATITRI